jgi:hypothetical protein
LVSKQTKRKPVEGRDPPQAVDAYARGNFADADAVVAVEVHFLVRAGSTVEFGPDVGGHQKAADADEERVVQQAPGIGAGLRAGRASGRRREAGADRSCAKREGARGHR